MLKKLRGVSFEQVELAIATGDLIGRLTHPNPVKYPNQKVFLVRIEDYIFQCRMSKIMKKYFENNYTQQKSNEEVSGR